MQPINKNLFLGVILGPYALYILLAFVGTLLQLFGNQSIAMVAAGFSCFGMLFGIVSVVFAAILVFKIWESIQGKHARTTPGIACGFMFIPLFNLYWVFVAIAGWAKDFNAYIKAKNIETPSMAEGIALATSIAFVCQILSIIPLLGSLFLIAFMVLMFLFFSKAIDGANAVRAQHAPAPAGADTAE